MKTVLFVPGFQEDINSRDYAKTLKAIKGAGYKVEFVKINWFRTTIDQWVKELDEVYEQYNPADTILAGFSFGAMTAFMSAVKRSPSALWLFSLSPYFNEDLLSNTFNQSWLKHLGHRRTDSFMGLSFSKLVKNITSDTVFFYGEIELQSWPNIDYRHKAVKNIPNMKEVLIPGAKHDVTGEAYIQAIIDAITTA